MKTDSQIPRGIEVLVKKASVDSAFCELLIAKRADAANDIGLTLSDAETAMLKAIPEVQLIGIIRKTKVSRKARPAFMGYVATAMLAAVGVTVGCGEMGEDTEVNDTNSEMLNTTEDTELEDRSNSVDIDELVENGTLFENSSPYRNGTGLGSRPDLDNRGVPKICLSLLFSVTLIESIDSSTISRSHKDINKIINQRIAGIKYLYRKHKKSNPDLPEGKIVCNFDIIDDGSVKEVIVESDEIGNKDFITETVASISNWKFPPASGEVTVVVSFESSVDE